MPCWCAPPLQECHISKQGIHSIIHRKSIAVTRSAANDCDSLYPTIKHCSLSLSFESHVSCQLIGSSTDPIRVHSQVANILPGASRHLAK